MASGSAVSSAAGGSADGPGAAISRLSVRLDRSPRTAIRNPSPQRPFGLGQHHWVFASSSAPPRAAGSLPQMACKEDTEICSSAARWATLWIQLPWYPLRAELVAMAEQRPDNGAR